MKVTDKPTQNSLKKSFYIDQTQFHIIILRLCMPKEPIEDKRSLFLNAVGRSLSRQDNEDSSLYLQQFLIIKPIKEAATQKLMLIFEINTEYFVHRLLLAVS
jgi:hypothetical protein